MLISREKIISYAEEFTQTSPANFVSAEVALSRDLAGMRIFDLPIFAFGCASDGLYESYKSADIIGSHFLSPSEWLPGAKSVISFFLPFSGRIKSSNAENFQWPSNEWLHGRIEGQKFITKLSVSLQKLLSDFGYISIVPGLDARYKIGSDVDELTSNWSERHAAFACGLGTFGLSKGLITEKGMCGRFGSVLTELELPPDRRSYEDVYQYCTKCGLCIPHCPAEAISHEGQDSRACYKFIDMVLEKSKPRYGCGKCQIKVPCESCIP